MRFALLATIAIFAVGCSSGEDSETSTEGTPASDDGGTTSSAHDSDRADDGVGSDARVTSDSGSTKADTGVVKSDTGATTSPDAGGTSLDGLRVTCVDQINAYRATEGLPAYAGWTSAAACADAQSKADSESGKAHGTFGKCGESAQNECPGWPGPADTMIKGCLKMMWAEGPGEPFSAHGHYLNMSNKSFKSVACGFYKTPSGSWWSVQDFR